MDLKFNALTAGDIECGFLRADKANDRHWCALTDDILYSIKRVGDCCPLEIEEVNCE